ncbi:MAG: RluA family pseudouridine synthase [Acidimicrobiia bacterium]|nr:RluA family pseudouridine synthase [Acidimicrobiia bacterium]
MAAGAKTATVVTTEQQRFVVPQDLHDQRADRIVAALLATSRAAARAVVDAGDAEVAGVPVDAKTRLPAGTELQIVPPPPPAPIEPAPIDFGVAYEDEMLLVVDKPAGLVVHPGAGHRNDTLASGLMYRFPDIAELGEQHRWGLVHRLDRDTTGLLLVARTPAAQEFLQDALRARRISRVYWSVVLGEFDNVTGTIEAPIGRDPNSPTRMYVTAQGRRAVTHYRRVASWSGVTMLEVTLDTGRTHQIRVHLSAIDHPVAGDRSYGRAGPAEADPGRVWLHARQLVFPHPDGTRDVTVTAPVPSDLAKSLERLGPPLSGVVPDLS